MPTRPSGIRRATEDWPSNHQGRSRSRRSPRIRRDLLACQRHDATVGRISAATVSHSGLPISSDASSTRVSVSAASSRPKSRAQARRRAEAGGPRRDGAEVARADRGEIDGITLEGWSGSDAGWDSRVRSCMIFVTSEPKGSGFGSVSSPDSILLVLFFRGRLHGPASGDQQPRNSSHDRTLPQRPLPIRRSSHRHRRCWSGRTRLRHAPRPCRRGSGHP